MFAPAQLPQVRYENIALKGGLDITTPTLSTPPGYAKDAVNFEVSVTGGYSRLTGYERTDGRFSPSDALALQISVAAFLAVPVVGDIITGGTSGATGVVCDVGALYVALTKVAGVFVPGENLNLPGPVLAAVAVNVGGTQGPKQDAILLASAADIYRADILAVPGSGAILGGVYYNDTLYAVRNDVAALEAVFWKATPTGWQAVPYYHSVAFTAGAGSLDDGDTLTQGANTALVKRVVVESGDLEAGTAAGRLIITAPAPGSFAAGAATLTGGGTVTLSGAETQITRPPGGRYEFVIDNFGGQIATRRVYGADGVGLALEFDGDVIVPIVTSTVPDTPLHVAVFKSHLFLSFESSTVHSAPGLPYNFQGIDGASEIAVGDRITGQTVARGEQAGGAMVIYGRNSTTLLYGTGVADWQKVAYGEGSGCIRYSAQYLNEPYVLDDRGVITLKTSLNYGNFDQATLTSNIQPFINAKRTRVSASMVNRTKSQYRLFFNDGSGLFLTILNGKYLGCFPVEFPNIVTCAWAGETSSGSEVSFFGSDDGFVFQMEKGNNFDGAPLIASFTLTFNAIKSPRIVKRYRHAALEVTGSGYAQIDFGYTLGYGSSQINQPGNATYESAFAGVFWDSFTWDAFIWDGVTLMPTEAELRGQAENISLAISSGTNYVAPFTINSIIVHYTPRRGLR